jgi:glycosidase
VKSDAYIVGESWKHAQSVLEGDQFNGVMNYPLTDIIKAHFIDGKHNQQEFISLLTEQYMLYRNQVNECMFNILDSHDTARILTRCDEDIELEKQILAFTYLQLGTPCLYYGDEIGMLGENDPDCRKCMDWNEKNWNKDLRDFFKQLIALRKYFGPLIQQANLRWLMVPEDTEPLIKVQYSDGHNILIATFNTADHPLSFITNNTCSINMSSGYGANTLAPKGFVIESA